MQGWRSIKAKIDTNRSIGLPGDGLKFLFSIRPLRVKTGQYQPRMLQQNETAPAGVQAGAVVPRTPSGENASGIRDMRSQELNSVCPVPDSKTKKIPELPKGTTPKIKRDY
jgi:hypothetical protein